MWQPHVDAGGAVDARHVVVAVCAVDVHRQRAPRRIGLRVLKLGRRRAGHEIHQVLIISVLIEREVDDVGRLELGADVSFVGLEEGRFGRDGH